MKRIYLFMILAMGLFAACSSNTGTVKSDATPDDSSQTVEATQPAKSSDAPVVAKAAPVQQAKATSNVFHHAGAGFSITKPNEWNYLSPEMVSAARESVKLNDQDLEKMIKENPNAPLVVFTRYPEPYPTLNPSVAVTMVHMPVEGMPPKDVLNMSTEVLKRAYPDLTYVDEVQDADVDGIQSAYTKVKYTMTAGDKTFPTTTRMWLVPRGKVMFTVGMSGPQDGPDESEESFKSILRSIKFDE